MIAVELRDRFLAIEAKLAMVEDEASLNVRKYLARGWGRVLVVLQAATLYLLIRLLLYYEERIKELR